MIIFDRVKKKGGKKADFGELSGRFYSLIPTKSGFTKPPAINKDELLGAERGSRRLSVFNMTEHARR